MNTMSCEQTFAWLSWHKEILSAMPKTTTIFTYTEWYNEETSILLDAIGGGTMGAMGAIAPLNKIL